MKQRGNWLVLFLKDERGAVIILVAFLLVFVLLGMVALSVDVGYLYLQKRHLQNTADAAALAAAWELPWTNPAITSTALEYAVHNHIVHDGNGTVVVASDPYNDNRKVKVEITKNYSLFFALAPPIGQTDADVYAMAVATKRMPGMDLLPFQVEVYDEIVGDKYRYHNYPDTTLPLYKDDCPPCKPKKDEVYDLVTAPHADWGDWANNKSDFAKVLKDILDSETPITLWVKGNSGNFGRADFSAFVDSEQNYSGSDLAQYVLNNGLDYEFCKDASKTRSGDTGNVSAIETSTPKPGGIKLSERLARDEGFYVILVLPGPVVKWSGSNNSYGIDQFLIGYVKPLTLVKTNPFELNGTLIEIIDCATLDPSSWHNRVILIE